LDQKANLQEFRFFIGAAYQKKATFSTINDLKTKILVFNLDQNS
jgi:hypothetical protein